MKEESNKYINKTICKRIKMNENRKQWMKKESSKLIKIFCKCLKMNENEEEWINEWQMSLINI